MAQRNSNVTVNRLKTMAKNEGSHQLRNLSRIFKYGASGFTRNIWLSAAATLVMTFTLVVLFVTIIASIVLSSTADAMREKIDITVYFKPGTSMTVLEQMATTMKQDPNVKSVTVADSEAEYQKFIAERADDTDLLEALSDTTMQLQELVFGGMQATMRIKVYDASDLDSIKSIVANDAVFAANLDTKSPTYNTNDQAISTITSWADFAKTGGLILSAVFLVISVLVIFNTIRMAIFSRREEIYMEKLVGGDNSFIRGPFLVEAMMSGVLAGGLASIIGYAIYSAAGPKLTEYEIDMSAVDRYFQSSWLVVIVLVMLLAGAAIGLLSSRLAVRKYLK